MIKGVDPQRTWWVSQGAGGAWFVSERKERKERRRKGHIKEMKFLHRYTSKNMAYRQG